MAKMNPEIKARWVAALRSGEYKQTFGVLKNSQGHCCLGVLCDLYAKERGMRTWSVRDLGGSSGVDEEPAFEVRKWAGLDRSDPKLLLPDGVEATAATLNDGRGKDIRNHTFAEIADAIEAQL